VQLSTKLTLVMYLSARLKAGN